MILEIDIQTNAQGVPVIHLRGEIDLHTCAQFRDALRDLIDHKNYDVIIDLAHVPYLDSAALGVLVDAVRRVREYDGSISLVATTPFVRRAFEITRLVKIFQLFGTEDEAQAEITGRRLPPTADPVAE
jgi:anti-sigma B factor antagonist